MTPRTAALLVVLASVVSVCRPGESRAPRERASAVAQQDTAFAGTLAPVQRVRSFGPGVARPVLRHVETTIEASPGGGYDRGVFESTGGGRQRARLPRGVHHEAGATLRLRRSRHGRRNGAAHRALRTRPGARRARQSHSRRASLHARIAGRSGADTGLRFRRTGRVGPRHRRAVRVSRGGAHRTGTPGGGRTTRAVRTRLAGLVVLALAAGCDKSPVQPCATAGLARIASNPQAPGPVPQFDSIFRAAGAEFHVSPSLLEGVGWVETRWQMVQGAEEFPGRPAAYGVMGLRGEALERGAALAGVTIDAARYDPVANIRAAAALLAAYAADAGGDWDAAAARVSGIDLAAGRAAYLG